MVLLNLFEPLFVFRLPYSEHVTHTHPALECDLKKCELITVCCFKHQAQGNLFAVENKEASF